MKILCVIDSLGSGGAQRQIVELAKGFVEKGHEVSFLTYHKNDFYKEQLLKNSIAVSCIVEANYLRRLIKMRRFIRSGNYNIVLSFLQASNFISEIAGFPWRNWKLIVGERSANPNILKSFKLKLFRWFHFFADFVVANSHENLKMVRKINPFLSNSKCHVIYNMVPSNLLEQNEVTSIENDSKVHFVIGASHQFLKNAKGMLNALLKLTPEQRKRIKISWFGDRIIPPYFDSSFENASEIVKMNCLSDIVEFYPATTDFLNMIKKADVVALFSLYEGLPNVVCEGMSLAKPIMASNVSDIPLLLGHNVNQIFDPQRPEEIARTFEYYLNLPAKDFHAIGCRNREVAIVKFDKEKILDSYLKLMKK